MIVVSMRFINKGYIGVYIVTAVLLFTVAEMLFGVHAGIVALLGRKPTLTDRTDVWELALQLQPNSLLGAGFESFWLGERLSVMWSKYWWKPNQAHNGYIETYLNLGYIGLFVLVALILATFRKIRFDLFYRPDFGRLRLGFLLAILAYNYTEATFKGVHLLWTVFYLVAVDYPRMMSLPDAEDSDGDAKSESHMALSEDGSVSVREHRHAEERNYV